MLRENGVHLLLANFRIATLFDIPTKESFFVDFAIFGAQLVQLVEHRVDAKRVTQISQLLAVNEARTISVELEENMKHCPYLVFGPLFKRLPSQLSELHMFSKQSIHFILTQFSSPSAFRIPSKKGFLVNSAIVRA